MKAVIGLASLTLVTSIAPAEVIIGYPGGRELSFSYDDNVILDSDDRVVHYRTAVRRLALSARNGIFRCGDRCCRATDGTIFVVDDPHSLARLLFIMGRTIYEREPSAETELLKV